MTDALLQAMKDEYLKLLQEQIFYGQHRSADPAPHGRPAQGAGAGDRGAIDPAASKGLLERLLEEQENEP
jgi:hypothetical protein